MFSRKNYLDFQTQLFLNPNFIFSKYVSISNLNPVADWNKNRLFSCTTETLYTENSNKNSHKRLFFILKHIFLCTDGLQILHQKLEWKPHSCKGVFSWKVFDACPGIRILTFLIFQKVQLIKFFPDVQSHFLSNYTQVSSIKVSNKNVLLWLSASLEMTEV